MGPLLARGVLPCVALLLATGCTDTTVPSPDELPSSRAPATDTGPVRPDPNFSRPELADADARAAFPTADDLGPGWDYSRAVSNEHDYGRGGAHESAQVPAYDQDVDDVLDSAVPDECLQLNPMPIPSTAVEVRYTFEDIPVTVSEVGFGSPAVAGAFFSLLVANREDCTAESGSEGRILVGQVVMLGEGVALSDRYPGDPTERRSDLAVRTDTTVVMLQAPVELGAEPFTSTRALRVARVFRGATTG